MVRPGDHARPGCYIRAGGNDVGLAQPDARDQEACAVDASRPDPARIESVADLARELTLARERAGLTVRQVEYWYEGTVSRLDENNVFWIARDITVGRSGD